GCVTRDLTPGSAGIVRHWLTVMLDGDTRARPRTPSTLRAYFSSARPFLEHWATRYDHLRESHPPRHRRGIGTTTRLETSQRHHRASLAVPVR
ncbi:hypothetical protein K7711_47115, partial [Nocardia sp. CA2R105]|nr:hypothetical protein [Nocardia coffeae]